MSPQLEEIAVHMGTQVGAELIIFIITAILAVIFKAGIRTPKSSSQTERKSENDLPLRTEVLRPSPPSSSSSLRSNSSKSAAAAASIRAMPSQEIAKLLDSIVDTVRSRKAPVDMQTVLANYRRVQEQLRVRRLQLSEITWHSRYSASDLYTAMVQCVTRTSRCYLIEQIINDMVWQGVPRSVFFYESALKQLAGQKQYDLALCVYDRMAGDGLVPSAVTTSCLVSFAAETGQYRRATEFFDKLTKLTKPSIRAWMTLLRVHNKTHNWTASMQALRTMQRQGMEVDTLALNVLLSTAVACDKVEEAEELLVELSPATRPDVVTFNTLIKGYMQRGEIEEAIAVLDRMQAQKVWPNSISFNTIQDKMMKDKGFRADKALLLAEKMAKFDVSTCPASSVSHVQYASPEQTL